VFGKFDIRGVVFMRREKRPLQTQTTTHMWSDKALPNKRF